MTESVTTDVKTPKQLSSGHIGSSDDFKAMAVMRDVVRADGVKGVYVYRFDSGKVLASVNVHDEECGESGLPFEIVDGLEKHTDRCIQADLEIGNGTVSEKFACQKYGEWWVVAHYAALSSIGKSIRRLIRRIGVTLVGKS